MEAIQRPKCTEIVGMVSKSELESIKSNRTDDKLWRSW